MSSHTSPQLAEMSLLTWNKVYSNFPATTHIQHKSCLLRELDSFPEMGKFKTVQRPISGGPRRIRDSHNWIIDLDTTGVEPPQKPDYVPECSEFNDHSCRGFGYKFSHYRIYAQVLATYALKYKYTFSKGGAWKVFEERMDSAAFIEMYQMDPEKRPEIDVGRDQGGSGLGGAV